MGLFHKNPPCPICGGKISWFLPTKMEEFYICYTCSKKLDIEEDILEAMTLSGLKNYLAFYEENEKLKKEFTRSKSIDFGFLEPQIIFDYDHDYFCMSNEPNKTIFEGAELEGFVIKEDQSPIFTGSSKGLLCYTSNIPDKIMEIAPQIELYLLNRRISEAVERLDKEDERRKYYCADIAVEEPFSKFYIELYLNHPYWKTIKCEKGAPRFFTPCPNVEDYMKEYRRDSELMEEVARALMKIAFPQAGEEVINNKERLNQFFQQSGDNVI